jgi:anti-sigma factor RsiW
MNGVHPSHDLLQRHHDGDLTGDETAAEELRVHLDACDKCQAELASMARLGQLLRSSVSASAVEEPDFTRMFAEIQKAVVEPAPTASNAAPNTVVPLRQTHKNGPNKHGPRWLYRTAPALGAVALAAAALLIVYRPDTVPTTPGESIARRS